MNEKKYDSVQIEKENWDKYFEKSLNKDGEEHKNKLWWNIVDRDASNLVLKYFHNKKSISVLEAGCGSGGTTFYLSNLIKINPLYLVDISSNALAFARSLENQTLASNIHYINSDIFKMKIQRKFDLVWNVGLIEHYTPKEIEQIIYKMHKTTAVGGVMIVGIPNRRSIVVLKAALLGSKFGKNFLFWIPGYRNDTEILYSNKEVQQIIEKITKKNVKIDYIGSCICVGSPNFLVKFFDKYFKLKYFAFLTFFSVTK